MSPRSLNHATAHVPHETLEGCGQEFRCWCQTAVRLSPESTTLALLLEVCYATRLNLGLCICKVGIIPVTHLLGVLGGPDGLNHVKHKQVSKKSSVTITPLLTPLFLLLLLSKGDPADMEPHSVDL